MMPFWDSLAIWYLAIPFFMASMKACFPVSILIRYIEQFYIGLNFLVCLAGLYGLWSVQPVFFEWSISPSLWIGYFILSLFYAASWGWGHKSLLPVSSSFWKGRHKGWLNWGLIGNVQLALAGITPIITLICMLSMVVVVGRSTLLKNPVQKNSLQGAKVFFISIASWIIMMAGLVCLKAGLHLQEGLVVQKQAVMLFYLGAFLGGAMIFHYFLSLGTGPEGRDREYGLTYFAGVGLYLFLMQFEAYAHFQGGASVISFIHGVDWYGGILLLGGAFYILKKNGFLPAIFMVEMGLAMMGLGMATQNGYTASFLGLVALALLVPGLQNYGEFATQKESLPDWLSYAAIGLPPAALWVAHFLLLENIFWHSPLNAAIIGGLLVCFTWFIMREKGSLFLIKEEHSFKNMFAMAPLRSCIVVLSVIFVFMGPYMLVIPFYHAAQWVLLAAQHSYGGSVP